jgi:hypothetical protein
MRARRAADAAFVGGVDDEFVALATLDDLAHICF